MSTVRIPLFDTSEVLRDLRPELQRRIRAVVESGRFILGPEGEALERELAAYLGVRHVVGVGNGTDALRIALLALGVRPGDDVVVPSFTFYGTVEPVVHVGARPVFCDIDPDTLCITRKTVERALTPRSRVIVPVHLFGTPAPIDELLPLARERGVKVLEDSAQAAGASLDGRKAGNLGDAATFSFYPSKNLFCLGDGGAIATNDDEVAHMASLLRRHGAMDKEEFTYVGFNSRLDEIQAAVVRAVLERLDELNGARRRFAAAYEAAGLGRLVSLPHVPDGSEPVHHLYVASSEQADSLVGRLREAGIGARGYYRIPVHRQKGMRDYASGVELPGTDRAAATNLALPMGPTYSADIARMVVEALEAS